MKKTICFLLTAVMCIIFSVSAFAAVPSTYSEAYIVMDATTGQVLLEKNAHKQMYPASITKILTTAIALDRGDMSDNWEMSYKATHSIEPGSTHIALTEGEVVTVKDLVYTTMIESANDSANGLAEYIAGDIDNFPAIMNETAKSIGADNSNFKNAHGLPDPEHYTTCYDMALITKWALGVEGFREVFGAEEYHIDPTNKQPGERNFGTHNHMLVQSKYYYEGTKGGKLGWTEEAQHTLVELVKRGDMELIVVVMKSQTQYLKYQDVIALCDYCFENFGVSTFSGALFEREPIPVVENGKVIGKVTLSTDDISVNRPSTMAKADITCTVDAPSEYTKGTKIAPNAVFTDKKDNVLAVVPLGYTYEDVKPVEPEVFAAENVLEDPDREASPLMKTIGTVLMWAIIIISALFILLLIIRTYNIKKYKKLREEKLAKAKAAKRIKNRR